MTPLEYMEKQRNKQKTNLEKETARNAPKDVLRHVKKKIGYYEAAVKALERPKGFNTYDHNGAFKCSICGFEDWDTLTADIAKYNYCPACGASMDEKRSNFEN